MQLFDFYQLIFGLIALIVMGVGGKKPSTQSMLLVGLLPFQYFFLPPRSLMLWSITELLLLLIVVRNRKTAPSPFQGEGGLQNRRSVVLIACWLGTWLGVSLNGVDPKNSLVSLAGYFSIVLILYALALMGEEGVNHRALARGFSISLSICVIVVLMQLLFDVDLGIFPSLNDNVNVNGRLFEIRYPGPFRDAQAFGQYLAVSILFVFIGRDHTRMDGRSILGFLGFCCLMINGTRIALLGLIVGGIYTGYVTRRLTLKMLLASAGVVIGLGVMLLVVDIQNVLLFQRLAEAEDSFAVRFAIWVKSFAIFRAYPLTGIGFENFAAVILDFDPGGFWHGAEGVVAFNHPESTYLKFLIETGIVGFTAFLVMVAGSFRRYSRAIRAFAPGESGRMFLVAGGGAYAALLTTFISVYTLNDPRIFFLFSFLTVLPFLYPGPRRLLKLDS